MSLNKITDADLSGKGVIGQPDTPGLETLDMQRKVEEIVRDVVIVWANNLADTLTGTTGAAEIGTAAIEGLTGANVQAVVEALKAYTDENKVAKEKGKGLSANDYDNLEKAEVAKVKEKVDKIPGKGLSAEDFTALLKAKLDGIAENANNYVLPVATAAAIGGVKPGFGVEVLPDGTINGVSAPAPDLIARAELAEHMANTVPHITGEERTGWNAKAELPRVVTLTLPAASWSGEGPYTQAVTIPGLTASTQVNLSPDDGVLARMLEDGTMALLVRNTDGAAQAVAMGEAPTADIAVQADLMEVTV